MKKNLLILGAGEYGTVVKEIAESMNVFDKISFLDDSYNGQELLVGDSRVIGCIADLKSFDGEYDCAIPAIGNAEIRAAMLACIERETAMAVPCIISPCAYVSPLAILSPGVVVEPLAGVHACARIGASAYISMGAVVNHSAEIGAFCQVDCNAVVAAGSTVENMTRVPCGSVVSNRVLPVKH